MAHALASSSGIGAVATGNLATVVCQMDCDI